MTKLGATPVGMPLPQIPDALSKGVIDGAGAQKLVADAVQGADAQMKAILKEAVGLN